MLELCMFLVFIECWYSGELLIETRTLQEIKYRNKYFHLNTLIILLTNYDRFYNFIIVFFK